MRNGILAVAIAGSMFLAACNSDRDIIGSYIGGDESAKMMLRISEVEDQKISGEFTFVSVSEDGEVEAATRPLSGTIDSGLLNLAVEGGNKLSLINGVADEDALELTFIADGGSYKMTFDRRDPKDFADAIEGARKRAAEMVQEREADAVRQAGLRQLSSDQDRINALASDLTFKAGNVADSAARIESIATDHRQMRNRDAAARHEWARGALRILDEAERGHEERASVTYAMCNTDPRLDCSGVQGALALYRSKAASLRAAADREQAAYNRLRRSVSA